MNQGTGSQPVRVALRSFGFKYGVPEDAQLVLDMRFLPNPFWIPELKPFSGKDSRIRDYVLGQPGAERFITNYVDVVSYMADRYRRKGKDCLMLAVGCTGGKHRSVVSVEFMAKLLAEREWEVTVEHRDLGRE